MPTENERKYVICAKSEDAFARACVNATLIRQAYVDETLLRVREKVPVHYAKHTPLKGAKPKYEFCFKRKIKGRLLEIETEIDAKDFNDLYELSSNRLVKIRYDLIACAEGQEDALWEVDFFKDKDFNTYFALAEHEMPEGQVNPNFIPDIIGENLVFEVPATDSRFSSKRLSNKSYAKKMLKNVAW